MQNVSYEEILKEEGINESELPEKTRIVIKDLKATAKHHLCKDKETGELKEASRRKIEIYNDKIIDEIYSYMEDKGIGKQKEEQEKAAILAKQKEEQEKLAAEQQANNAPQPATVEPPIQKEEKTFLNRIFGN
jgi:hypothetical protein